jgi:hypothetical protein
VLIGADSSASLTNLRHAILGTGGTPGTDYQVPAAHPTVTASAIVTDVLPLVAITAGTAGNSIALAETSAQLSISAATLLGGRAAQGMSGELLDDYEVGTWSPRYATEAGELTSVQMGILAARYVKVGPLVTIIAHIYTESVTPTAATAGAVLCIRGLPYTPILTGAAGGITVGQARLFASNTPLYGNIQGAFIGLRYRSSVTGNDINQPLNSLSTSAVQNSLVFYGTYYAA